MVDRNSPKEEKIQSGLKKGDVNTGADAKDSEGRIKSSVEDAN
jgi:hypothetical protein